MVPSRVCQQSAALVRTIGDTYVLWLASGNRFLRLEEPAFYVGEGYLSGADRHALSHVCASRYGVSEPDAMTFVDDVIGRIESRYEGPAPDASVTPVVASPSPSAGNSPGPASTAAIEHRYLINGKVLRFRFGRKRYEGYLHPLLAHLETSHAVDAARSLELASHPAGVELRVDGQLNGRWKEDETHLVKGAAFLRILNAAYSKTDDEWMAAVHASAVTDGSKAVLFSARPGSGKSTLAALLCREGYRSVSDDFVPIDRASGLAFPFPAAMSVKRGAQGVLAAAGPCGRGDAANGDASDRAVVAHLPLPQHTTPVPVGAVVFVKYAPTVTCELEQLSAGAALGRLLDETWTYPSAQNAVAFLDWVSALSFFRLTYSVNSQAFRSVADIFAQ
jgi:hypothetical protein